MKAEPEQAAATIPGWDRSTVTHRLKIPCFQALIEDDGDQRKAMRWTLLESSSICEPSN